MFPERVYPIIRRCPPPTDDPTDIAAVTYIRDVLLPELDPCVYIVLSHYLRKPLRDYLFTASIDTLLDLMHEVSLRSATNRMDAHNLAVVLCPNLVSGPDPMRDVMMCAVPGGPALYDAPPSASQALNASQEGRTTLGAVIKLAIQRYYEVFDEVPDRTEAIPRPRVIKDQPSPAASSFDSGSRRHSGFPDDEEEIDDAMLVMSIGPSGSAQQGGTNPAQQALPTTRSTPNNWPYAQRVRGAQPGGRSTHTTVDNTGNGIAQSAAKARSMISIDNGRGLPGSRKGSISIGKSTSRKSSGAGVEAIGVTADGFFSPPNSAPPVPTRRF